MKFYTFAIIYLLRIWNQFKWRPRKKGISQKKIEENGICIECICICIAVYIDYSQANYLQNISIQVHLCLFSFHLLGRMQPMTIVTTD